ncbi:MAG: phage holin family protein [Acidobacteriota bacterium]
MWNDNPKSSTHGAPPPAEAVHGRHDNARRHATLVRAANLCREVLVNFLVRWFIGVLALMAAAWVVPGIRVEGQAWVAYAVMAVVLGLVNTVIRPLLKLLTCPLIILTLGLFVLVINAVTLLLAARLTQALGVPFVVDGFGAAFWGALIVSLVTVVLTAVAREE